MNQVNATPVRPTTSKDETIKLIAKGFFEQKSVQLGVYTVTKEESGWDTKLIFVRETDEAVFIKNIDSDGLHHAAEQAYKWWTNDAWNL